MNVEYRVARAGLLRWAEPPASVIVDFVAGVGLLPAFEAVIRRDAPRAVLAATAARTADRSAAELIEQAAADLTAAQGVGAQLLCPEDAAWPAAAMIAFEMAESRGVSGSAPPLALYVRGALGDQLPGAGITIIGSRASSSYGERVAAEIAMGVAEAGYTVVSGGAFGIDTAAHRAAIYAGGTSLAVLACGIDRVYPVANSALLAEVARTGALVSEYAPGMTPARHRFLVRNRLLAALSSVTVVVEAGRRSGSLSTASAAGHLGRTVMAVPGPVTSAMSVGCHVLLRERFASLASGPQDVLAAAPPLVQAGPGASPRTGCGAADSALFDDPRARPTDGLDPLVARVYDALPARTRATVADLAVSAGIAAAQVLGVMPLLEIAGLARRDSGYWRRV